MMDGVAVREGVPDGWERHLAPPRQVIVESSSRCNFLCPLCLWTKNKRHGYLDVDTFARFLDGAAATTELLCFSGRGEPTLNPRLFDVLALAVEAGVQTDLVTNGSSLLRDADAILESGIDNLNVSIDADNPEDYVRYRVNGNFDEVIAGMMLLAEEKRRRGLQKPTLRTCSVILEYNGGRLAELRRFFGDLGFETFIFKSAHLGHGQLAEGTDILAQRWLPRDPSLVRFRHVDPASGPPRCEFLYRAHLLWNGDVCRCAIDHVRMVVGNVNRQTFEEIWSGAESRRAVQTVVRGEFDKCADCWLNAERRVTETGDGLFMI
jgi:radical SAM protein with 4Fe4S-binding SPASM domain